MSISVPYSLYYALWNTIFESTRASLAEASVIAELVIQVAQAAAGDGLSQSRAYTDTIEGRIYNNLDTDLNLVMDYTDRQVDIVKDGLTDAILLLQTQIENLDGGVSEEIGEELVQAYDGIADSHTIVGNLIDATLASVGAQVAGSYEEIGTWIHDGFEGALAVVNSTIDHIIKGIEWYVQAILDFVIPAEQQAFFETVGKVLLGDPMRVLFDYGGAIFQSKMNDVLTIDDDELQKWITKGSEYVQGIAMQSAKPEGVT